LPRRKNGPEWAVWIVTGSCNLSCPYCYAKLYASEPALSEEEALRLAEELAKAGVEYVNVTGGEPLLWPPLFSVVEALASSGVEVSVFTNLLSMTKSSARRLAELGASVLTSLDGPREVYERAKGSGAWEKFLEGLAALREEGVPLHVNVTVSRLNFSRVGGALKLAFELGASSASIIPAMPNRASATLGFFASAAEYFEALKQASEVARELGARIAAWCSPFVAALEELRGLASANCREWKVVDISPSGSALVCDVLGIPVANVLEEGLLEAWRKLKEHPLYKKAMELPEECRSCKYARACGGGCYARAYFAYGVLPAPDPLCPLASSQLLK